MDDIKEMEPNATVLDGLHIDGSSVSDAESRVNEWVDELGISNHRQEFHEWFGTGMLVLFIVHNNLNIKWYSTLLKGKYMPLRIVQTIVNFGVFISMLCLGFSGIVMSRHVFAALPISGPMATARSMHIAASYWGLY